MPIFILYFLAAGAAGLGGPAIGAAFLKRGQQARAAYIRQQDIDEISRLLRSEMGLAELRREAEQAGVDPELVEHGYFELRDGHITIEQITARLDDWSLR
jgi:hypothetical protein